MNQQELIEFTNQKGDLIHLRRLLGETKAAIQLAMNHNPQMEYHFSKIWKSLEANGIKCCFDSGREYDAYIKGVKNA